ncbi:hypothetical protein PVL29_013037 [Vitis rotundifolia]|uniref:Uncharacterized protein n=1 Tax=Vitis rotundifolia TaxID=103349 RepID=A0AA39DNS5_VITRO|nr:hypothetical protein PVL29_013037 [Vitis rotundifolia]
MNTQGDNFITKITKTSNQDQEQNKEKGKCESVEAEPVSRRTNFPTEKRDMRLVAPKMKRVATVERPTVVIWEREGRGSEMATAAMDFMGWTSIGMPKRKPMEML